jgi:acyl carrier protein
MIPSTFVMLEKFPRTPTGKVDRKALPPPGRARPHLDRPFVAPRNPVEQVLAGIWAERLDLDAVGIDDHFLELGGDSLLATQILSRVREEFRLELPLRILFEAPTVAELCLALVESEPEPGWVELVARKRQQIERMSVEDVRAELQQLDRGGVSH